MSSASHGKAELDQIRDVLFRGREAELDELRTTHLKEVSALNDRIAALERAIEIKNERSELVSEVLPEAVTLERTGKLDAALQPKIETAIKTSIREDSAVLAEALYPVLGPAVRKMVANMLTPESMKEGRTFQVEQLLLIERQTGLVLAASALDESKLEDADVISGMMDAIRRFVQEAFDADDHDGLRDLRVGDTSVLVEWGPRAVLASVVRGVPDEQYREESAVTLEILHRQYGDELEQFSGDLEPFVSVNEDLSGLHGKTVARTQTSKLEAFLPLIALAIAVVLIVAVIVVWLTNR